MESQIFISPCKNIPNLQKILQKKQKSFKILYLKFQHKLKYHLSYKNPHIKIDLLLFITQGPKSLKATTLYNESRHNILAYQGKANKQVPTYLSSRNDFSQGLVGMMMMMMMIIVLEQLERRDVPSEAHIVIQMWFWQGSNKGKVGGHRKSILLPSFKACIGLKLKLSFVLWRQFNPLTQNNFYLFLVVFFF